MGGAEPTRMALNEHKIDPMRSGPPLGLCLVTPRLVQSTARRTGAKYERPVLKGSLRIRIEKYSDLRNKHQVEQPAQQSPFQQVVRGTAAALKLLGAQAQLVEAAEQLVQRADAFALDILGG
jgi:hypothetical protein